MAAKLKIAVLGATGYSGLELTRILARHPQVAAPLLFRRNGDRQEHAGSAETFPRIALSPSPIAMSACSSSAARVRCGS